MSDVNILNSLVSPSYELPVLVTSPLSKMNTGIIIDSNPGAVTRLQRNIEPDFLLRTEGGTVYWKIPAFGVTYYVRIEDVNDGLSLRVDGFCTSILGTSGYQEATHKLLGNIVETYMTANDISALPITVAAASINFRRSTQPTLVGNLELLNVSYAHQLIIDESGSVSVLIRPRILYPADHVDWEQLGVDVIDHGPNLTGYARLEESTMTGGIRSMQLVLEKSADRIKAYKPEKGRTLIGFELSGQTYYMYITKTGKHDQVDDVVVDFGTTHTKLVVLIPENLRYMERLVRLYAYWLLGLRSCIQYGPVDEFQPGLLNIHRYGSGVNAIVSYFIEDPTAQLVSHCTDTPDLAHIVDGQHGREIRTYNFETFLDRLATGEIKDISSSAMLKIAKQLAASLKAATRR